MTRHPTARRLHQQKGPDDAATERLLQFALWAKANMRILVAGVVIVLVGILALNYAGNVREAKLAEAARRLDEVRLTVASGNHSLAIRDLEEFISIFSGTAAADEARLLLGQSAIADSQATKAIEVLTPLANSTKNDLATPAALLLAAAYEEAGDHDKAAATYLALADKARDVYSRRDALQHAARVKEGQGDAAGAVEIYQRLLEETSDGSPERGVVELRLAEARARAVRN